MTDEEVQALSIKLHSTTDGMVWTEEFIRLFEGRLVGGDDLDRGTLVGWFANAIETGRTFGARS